MIWSPFIQMNDRILSTRIIPLSLYSHMVIQHNNTLHYLNESDRFLMAFNLFLISSIPRSATDTAGAEMSSMFVGGTGFGCPGDVSSGRLVSGSCLDGSIGAGSGRELELDDALHMTIQQLITYPPGVDCAIGPFVLSGIRDVLEDVLILPECSITLSVSRFCTYDT